MRASDPRTLLKKGYVLAVGSSGVVLRSVAGVRAGDRVSLIMADGRLDCTVDSAAVAADGMDDRKIN